MAFAQDRVNQAPTSLSYKSKEITKATYWEQDGTGSWVKANNIHLVYKGEGVNVENFHSMFIGKCNDNKYLFLDYRKYVWAYPALQLEWSYVRYLKQALLSENDYEALQNLAVGETFIFKPRFYEEMSMASPDYNFPFFLKLNNTLYSSTQSMYDSYLNHEGEDRAERYWNEKYPAVPMMIIKRFVGSDGKDVVRFRFGAITELIDSCYFEIGYDVYQTLFTPDKKLTFKAKR